MVTSPTWQAATSGQAANAGHVNQMLSGHTATVLYTGVQAVAQNTAGATTTSSNGLYLAQSFVTAAGQTTIGYVQMPLTGNSANGSNLGTITVSLYNNGSGSPIGLPIVTTTVTAEYTYAITGGATTTFVTIPLPASGLTPGTTYWIVTTPAGGATYSYTWHRSNQTSGASTSSNGTTWTAQTYGLQYRVFDRSVTGPQVATWEDGGARWTTTTWTAAQQIATFAEYTAGQTPAGYLQAYRAFAYTNGALTSIT